MKIKVQARLGWSDLFEARDFKGDQNYNYSAKFYIEHGSKADAEIKEAIRQVAEEKWKGKAAAKLASFGQNKMQVCYIDGALDGNDDYMILSAKRKQADGRPDIRDRNAALLSEKDGRPYPGCHVIGIVDIWAQDSNGYAGIRCQLLGVQFVRDGQALSSSKRAADSDFEDLGVEEDSDMFA